MEQSPGVSGWKSLKKRVDGNSDRKRNGTHISQWLSWNFPSSSVQQQPKERGKRTCFSSFLPFPRSCRVSSLGNIMHEERRRYLWEPKLETLTRDAGAAWTIRILNLFIFQRQKLITKLKLTWESVWSVQIWVFPFDFFRRSLNFPKTDTRMFRKLEIDRELLLKPNFLPCKI